MGGGKMIVWGLVVVLVSLWALFEWHIWAALWHVLLGGGLLVMLIVGAVFLYIAVSDTMAQRAERKAATTPPARSGTPAA